MMMKNLMRNMTTDSPIVSVSSQTSTETHPRDILTMITKALQGKGVKAITPPEVPTHAKCHWNKKHITEDYDYRDKKKKKGIKAYCQAHGQGVAFTLIYLAVTGLVVWEAWESAPPSLRWCGVGLGRARLLCSPFACE